MKGAWALAASVTVLGSLWIAAPQGIDSRQTNAGPTRPRDASEVARLHGFPAAEAGRLTLEQALPHSRPSAAEAAGASDPSRTLDFVAEVLATLNDREILDAVSRLTELDEEDFDTIQDLRKHVLRLVEVAVGPPLPESAEIAPVDFARSVNPDGDAVLEDFLFHDRSRAIYAVFPTDSLPNDAVYVKWQRSDASEPLHLDRHSVDPSRDRNYVWLEPGDGWSEGTYRVEVYAANEELTPLAVGRFGVVPIAQFPGDDADAEKTAALLTAR